MLFKSIWHKGLLVRPVSLGLAHARTIHAYPASPAPAVHARPTSSHALGTKVCRYSCNLCIGCCGNGFTWMCYVPVRWPFLHFASCWSKQISRSATPAVFANRATYRHVKHLVSAISHARRSSLSCAAEQFGSSTRIFVFARSPAAR